MEESRHLSPKLQEEVHKALEAVKKGRVILYPTDTIWGLGCDITNQSAVERIYEIKNRPRTMPLILLVSSIKMLKDYVEIHPRIETLLSYHKKPLTLIYPKTRNLPEYILSKDGSIGIRVAQDDFCQVLISQLEKPIVSTSANMTGEPYPKSYDDIDPEVKKLADHIVDYQPALAEEEVMPSIIATFNHKGELDFIRT